MRRISPERLALVFILLSFISFSQLFSQNNFTVDSLLTGRSYRFVMYDQTEIIGKVTGVNDKQVKLITGDGTEYVLTRDNILYYSTDFYYPSQKFSLSLLGGMSMFTSGSRYYDGMPQSGMNLSLAGIFYLTETKAFKLDLGYIFLKAKHNSGGYFAPLIYPYFPTIYDGGDVSFYSLKGNILLGSFNPKNKLSFYGSVGFGFNLAVQTEINEQYYDYIDSVYKTRNVKPKKDINAIFSLGGGLIVNITKRLGIHAEIEYHLITNDDEYFFFYSTNSYFPIRAGIKYSVF